jgi:Ni,Fe-hydrogenase maturation factor
MITNMRNIKTIYIFGNPLLPFDSIPIELKKDLENMLPNFEFIVQDPNENLKPKNKELIIIDTIQGIDKVIILNEIDKIENSPKYSMHDFDLGFNLKLLQKIGELEKVTIFGVPMKIKKQAALKQLIFHISNTLNT